MTPFSLDIKGTLYQFESPVVMGIINITPDSFYAPSRHTRPSDAAATAIKMVEAGAGMLDLGACSSRPGAAEVSPEEEMDRLCQAVRAVRAAVGNDILISIDTFRANVAREAIEVCGADIVNDISGGKLDTEMFDTVAALGCPYVLMHMRGTPATMQSLTQYEDVVTDVIADLSESLALLRQKGVADVIIDPGFGFAKTLEQNYALMRNMQAFKIFDAPVLVGISRKSMLTRLLGIQAEHAEIPTAILNAYALERGADILRVHDPLAAAQAVKILKAIETPC